MSEAMDRFVAKSRAICDEVAASIANSLEQELRWMHYPKCGRLMLGTLCVGTTLLCRDTNQAYWQAFDCFPIRLQSICSDQVEGGGDRGIYANLEDAADGLYAYVSAVLARYRANGGDEA